jgi:hypothetical protein
MRLRFRHAILGTALIGLGACVDPTAPPRPEPTDDDDDEKSGVVTRAIAAAVPFAGTMSVT